jgi:hypothetical protein
LARASSCFQIGVGNLIERGTVGPVSSTAGPRRPEDSSPRLDVVTRDNNCARRMHGAAPRRPYSLGPRPRSRHHRSMRSVCWRAGPVSRVFTASPGARG